MADDDCGILVLTNKQTLHMQSAERLVGLLEMFTKPRVLLAAENNYTWARLILQSMNNLVQFQMDSNVHLVYTLVRHSEAIFKVASLNHCRSPSPQNHSPPTAR